MWPQRLAERQIVAMNRRFGSTANRRLHLVRLESRHARKLGGRVVADALADEAAGAVELNRVTWLELTLNGADPYGEQGGTSLAQRAFSASVDGQ